MLMIYSHSFLYHIEYSITGAAGVVGSTEEEGLFPSSSLGSFSYVPPRRQSNVSSSSIEAFPFRPIVVENSFDLFSPLYSQFI